MRIEKNEKRITYSWEVKKNEIFEFLRQVDDDFSIPLSKKEDLDVLAQKFFDFADVLTVRDSDNQIIGLLAGYLKNAQSKVGYISVVAIKREFRGIGLSKKMLKKYLVFAENMKRELDAVELYTTSDNIRAMKTYKSVGFVSYFKENETRKEDVHLIYYLGERI